MKALLDEADPLGNKVQKSALVSNIGYDLFGQIVFILAGVVKKSGF